MLAPRYLPTDAPSKASSEPRQLRPQAGGGKLIIAAYIGGAPTPGLQVSTKLNKINQNQNDQR